MYIRKKPSRYAVATPEEIEIINMSKDDPSILTDYFFRLSGSDKGWIFDENFEEAHKWQGDVCMAVQKDIVIIGGFGSGKTMGIAMAACFWALTTYPDFKFMNAAPTSKQSAYMYGYIITQAKGTRFDDFIAAAPETPYPSIEIKYWYGDTLVESSLEFASVKDDADSIYGWEGDWLNLDEAFMNDSLATIIAITGSRLRGSIHGRERLGRFSMITNSHDNMTGWQYADMAFSDPKNYLTKIIPSTANRNLTEDQVKKMASRIADPEDRKRLMMGTRPEGKGIYFNKFSIAGAESALLDDLIRYGTENSLSGYNYESVQTLGLLYYHMPKDVARTYILTGDPGTDNAPGRNAPALMVFDVTDLPNKPAPIVAAWWGSGNGSITPFVGMLFRLLLDYNPVFAGIDSTGPQKSSAELINIYLNSKRLEEEEINRWLGQYASLKNRRKLIKNYKILGMDFSGGKKSAYLRTGQMYLDADLITWPSGFNGLRSQLANYDPDLDKATSTTKIAQDLVATFCMGCYAIRVFFDINPEDLDEEKRDPVSPEVEQTISAISREVRSAARSGAGRSTR